MSNLLSLIFLDLFFHKALNPNPKNRWKAVFIENKIRQIINCLFVFLR